MNYSNFTTREFFTGLILQELVNGFNFNAGIEDKLEDRIDGLITEAIEIADRTCAKLDSQVPAWASRKKPEWSRKKPEWADSARLRGQVQWILYDIPPADRICLVCNAKGYTSIGYRNHENQWFQIETVTGETTKIPTPFSWLPVFIPNPKPKDHDTTD